MTLIPENQWKTYFSFNAFNVANKTSITFEPKLTQFSTLSEEAFIQLSKTQFYLPLLKHIWLTLTKAAKR